MTAGTLKNPALKKEIFDALGLTDARTKPKREVSLSILERQGYRAIKSTKGYVNLYVVNPDAPPGKPRAMYLRRFDSQAEAEKIGKKAADFLKKKYGPNFGRDK